MRFSNVFALTITAFLLLSVPQFAAAQKRRKAPVVRASVTVSAANPTPAQRRMEAFDTAWSTINESYFDKSFGGLDWGKIRSEFVPRVRAAKNDYQFHQILQEMINRLGKSHLSVIIPEYFERVEIAKKQARDYGKKLAAERNSTKNNAATPAEEDAEADLFGDSEDMRFGIGVELRMLDGEVVITQIDKQSGAAIAGLKPGYVIEKINDVSVKSLIDKAVLSGSSLTEVRSLLPVELVESMLNGEPDSFVYLAVRDENDKVSEFTVPRLELHGETVLISTNLPEQFLKYNSASLSADVGYLKFSGFAVPVIEKFCNSLTEFRDKKAIIVDLRGNLGGLLASMIGLTGMVTEKPITLGRFNTRASSQPFEVPPMAKNFKGRIVVLVDGLSMSASELFAAGLRGNDRVVVVGERTGGQSLPAIWKKLPTGAVMIFPVADFIVQNGKSLEGVGLEPDHVVAMNRKSLLGGVDPQLQKALAVASDPGLFKAAAVESELPPPPPKPKQTPKPIESFDGSPPPVAKSTPVGSGSGDEILPPPSRIVKLGTTDVAAAPNDARAIKILSDFVMAVGGAERFRSVTTYELKGTMTMTANAVDGSLYSARQFPDKYMMEFNSPVIGEIRELFNGKESIVQTDYGTRMPLPKDASSESMHILSTIFDLVTANRLKSLKHEGEFEIEGRKRHILTARNDQSVEVGLSFDSATGMLVTYSQGPLLYTFADYRKTGDIQLPYSIDMERIAQMRFSSITLNPKLDPRLFEKKEKCFDKPL